ncbi:Ger(x)C family spore germination protein [Alkalibacillus almallahensis]|uniref:Ger(x)C family spore germination protein n=1 Tax=Alkalibacillus almallahensis TaxID=1379154 RepID=UPI0014221C13|nr:Ger(x)C family spore germination protein [Alkalibacillus almallahensis]NIK13089.1 spore germination protein [Alkalibacillus almallahensis]
MQNNRKITLLIVGLLSMMIIPSCSHSKDVIEKLGVVSAYGFDQNEEQVLEGTTVLYQFNPDITNASQIIHSTGSTFNMVRSNANKKSGYKIVNGKLQTLLFGPTIAKKGVFPYLDTIERDAAISDMLYVTISEEPARDILSASNYEEAPNIGVYLNRLVDTAVLDEKIVSSKFHEFMRDYLQVGREPLVPIISIKQNKAAIEEVGIMQGDSHVGSFSMKEIFFVRLLREEFNEGRLDLELETKPFQDYIKEYQGDNREDKMFIVIDQLQNNSKINLTNVDHLTYEVDVSIHGRIVEMSQRMNLDKAAPLRKLEEEIDKKIKKNLEAVVKKAQQVNADVFGFGVKYNNRTRGEELTREQWQDLFPNIEVDFNVSTEIKRFGIVQ